MSKEIQKWKLFVFQTKGSTFLGRMSIKYCPSVEDNSYGTATTELLFPVRSALPNSYPLCMFPKEVCLPQDAWRTENQVKMVENIESEDVAVHRLFDECNRQAKLIIASKLRIKIDELKNQEFQTSDIETGTPGPIHNNFRFPLGGDVVLKNLDYTKVEADSDSCQIYLKCQIKPGDKFAIDWVEIDPSGSKVRVRVSANTEHHVRRRFDWLYNLYYKLFDETAYHARTSNDIGHWFIPINNVKVVMNATKFID